MTASRPEEGGKGLSGKGEYMESTQVRLARMEERLNYISAQLDKLLVEADGFSFIKQSVKRHKEDLARVHGIINRARGMAIIVSAIVAFVAALLPDIFLK
jgi:hypothetical protein